MPFRARSISVTRHSTEASSARLLRPEAPSEMKTGAVYRQGRTRNVADGEMARREQCGGYLLAFLAVAAPVGLTFALHRSERYFFDQQVAFDAVEPLVRRVPNTARASNVGEGALVHFDSSSNGFTASVTDKDFGVTLQGGVKLARHTEYCQWQEVAQTECDTCHRSGKGGKDESYKCNCVETYHYVKSWRNHRIISIGFDQAANHHNPMRDPFPNAAAHASNAQAGEFAIDRSVMQHVRAPTRGVAYSFNAELIPPGVFENVLDFFGWHTPPPRFEDARKLQNFGLSNAHTQHNFIYTNTREGWFFSPHAEETWFRVLRGFGQFMEGSAMDWQIGDLYDMYNGCTAGDIRVNFQVADPRELSVIGKALRIPSRDGAEVIDVVPYIAPNGFEVAVVHAGLHGATQMFDNETAEARWDCDRARFCMLIAGFCASFLVQSLAGKADQALGLVTRVFLSGGLTQLMVGAVWASVYGAADIATPMLTAAGVLMTGMGVVGMIEPPDHGKRA